MYPILLQFKVPIIDKVLSIGGYGLMLGIGFYLGFLFTEREYKLRGINPDLAYKILLAAIPAGIIGSKIFHILEHWSEFMASPSDMIFSGAGLSAYGGYIFAFTCGVIILKINKENVMEVADATAPAMAFGYCFGRFGCHVAGDGCYGLETASFLGTAYPNGIVPNTSLVHATPLYEVMFSFFVVGLLMKLRKKDLPVGQIFFLYLILNGFPRLMVEFIRRNPGWIGSLTQAQVVGILLMITGAIGLYYTNKKAKTAPI